MVMTANAFGVGVPTFTKIVREVYISCYVWTSWETLSLSVEVS